MIIILTVIAWMLLYFCVEYFVKIKWLKHIFNLILVLATVIIMFNIGLEDGGAIVRYDAAHTVGDTLEFFEASITNDLPSETRAKLAIVKTELPKAILNSLPTTDPLLEVLRGRIPTNAVVMKNSTRQP